MKINKKTMLIIPALFMLSACKDITVLKDKVLSLTSPTTSSASSDLNIGIIVANSNSTDDSKSVRRVFGVDKNGKSHEITLADGSKLDNFEVANNMPVKSGMLFNLYKYVDGSYQYQTYFTADGINAQKVADSIRFYNYYSKNSNPFSRKNLNNFAYLCDQMTSKLLRWEDSNKQMTVVEDGLTNCQAINMDNKAIVSYSKVDETDNTVRHMKDKIIDLSTGSDLQVISDETHSVSAYYYTAIESPVELSSDSILYKKYIYTDTGYSNTMYKYTLSTKENKALLADDEANWMDQQYYNLSNPQVFNGKVYINHYHYKYDPSNPTPVYIEGTTNVAYSNYYSTAFEVLEYNISDDSIKSIFTISNYTNEIEVATHNGEPKIVVNQSVPVAAEGKTYTTINRLSIYNIDGSFILNMVANHSMYTDIIDNKIAMIDYDYTAQPKVATLYMLPDSGSTPIVQQVLSSLNTTYMNFFSYYGGIAVQYQDTTSEYSSVGILKDISNLDSFIKVDAVNATINNYND